MVSIIIGAGVSVSLRRTERARVQLRCEPFEWQSERTRFIPTEEHRAYIEAPLRLDGRFALLLIDGRFRRRCVETAMRVVSPGGLVLLCDAQRPYYHWTLEQYRRPFCQRLRTRRDGTLPGVGKPRVGADVIGATVSNLLLRDIALAGAAEALKILRVLVLLPLLTKSLGIEAYGVWTQIKVSSTFMGSLASLGMGSALLRFLSGEDRATAVRAGFNSALGAAVACTLFVVILLLTWPRLAASVLFGEPGLSVFVMAAGLYLVLEVIDLILMAYLRASRQMGFYLTGIAIELVGEVALVWAMVMRRPDLFSVVFGIIGWKALVVLSKLAGTWHQVGIAPPQASIIRRYLGFGIPLMLSGLGYLIVNYGDRYFIGAFMGIGPLGTYAAAYALGSLTIVLCTPIDYVMYPAIAAAWNAGRTSDAIRHVEMMLQWLVVLLVPILSGLAVLARPMLVTVATEEVGAAAPVAVFVAAGFAILYIGIVGERVLGLANRPGTVTAIYAGLAVVNVGLNTILIPRLGLMGAAVATLASFALYTVVTITKARARCHFALPVSIFWRSLIAGLVGAIVALPLAGDGVGRLALAAFGGTLAYVTTLVMVGAVRLETLRSVGMHPIQRWLEAKGLA